ncbi:MAG: ABC transporter permease [Acidobacteriota bacterium]|nr:ABC transporter permease [Acidobacteriota bacterium]
MSSLWRDLRSSFRSLARRPGFTVSVALLLGLGIGCNTAIFSLLTELFLNPFPAVEDPRHLVALFATSKDETGTYSGLTNFSHLDYQDYRSRNRTLSGLALFQWAQMNFTGGASPERVVGEFVSSNYFTVLGLHPARGRFFLPAEELREGAAPVAVLSYGCWQQRFGGGNDVLGKPVRLNGQSLTVVGIAPRGFRGSDLNVSVEIWVPVSMFKRISSHPEFFATRARTAFRLVGRLKPGVSAAQAQADVMAIALALQREFADDDKDQGATVQPLLHSTFPTREQSRYEGYGKNLAWAVLLILVIVCMNVANLLLVREMERKRELAILRAIGAGRRFLARRLLTEQLLLFFFGAALSLVVAHWTLHLLWGLRPPEFARDLPDPRLDRMALALSLLATLSVSLLFGLVPATFSRNPDLASPLKPGPSLSGPRLRAFQPRNLLVVGQVALALVALVGAGLFLRSLGRVQGIELGFQPANLIAVTVAAGDQGYDEAKVRDLYRQVLERVQSLPGVRSAALSENRLLRGAVIRHEVYVDGQKKPIDQAESGSRVNIVSPGFFRTAGIPLLAGRDFGAEDCTGCARSAIVNKAVADRAWPGQDPIGKTFHFNDPQEKPVRVVGIAADAKYRYVAETRQLFVYVPLSQNYAAAMVLHARTTENPGRLIEAVRRELRAIDPRLPLAEADTMTHFVAGALWAERTSALLLSIFGLLALLLATVGIYGLMAYLVEQRRREMGIRLALGARRSQVLRSVLASAATLAGAGLLLGWLLAAFFLTPLVAGNLNGVDPRDPVSYVGQSLILMLAALLASFFPARKAAYGDPVAPLREL